MKSASESFDAASCPRWDATDGERVRANDAVAPLMAWMGLADKNQKDRKDEEEKRMAADGEKDGRNVALSWRWWLVDFGCHGHGHDEIVARKCLSVHSSLWKGCW